MARDAQFFFAEEAVPGTAEAILPAQVIQCRSVSFNEGGPGPVQRDVLDAAADTWAPHAPPSAFWEGDFEMEVKAALTGAGVTPESDVPLQMGGFAESGSGGGGSVVYTLAAEPNGASEISGTIRKQEAPAGKGKSYVAAGCKTSLSFAGSNTSPLVMTGSYKGKWAKPVDLAALEVVVAGDYVGGGKLAKLKSGGGAFNFHSYNMIARGFTLDIGLEAQVRDNIGNVADFGYEYPVSLVRSGPVTGTVDIEEVDEGTFDLWTRYIAGTAAPGTIIYSDGTEDLTFALGAVVFGKIPDDPTGNPKRHVVPFTVHITAATLAPSVILTFT
jgi:hypothetical protein